MCLVLQLIYVPKMEESFFLVKLTGLLTIPVFGFWRTSNKCGDEEIDVLLSVSALTVTGKGSLLLLNYRQSPLVETTLHCFASLKDLH